jgi:hypothetical protein
MVTTQCSLSRKNGSDFCKRHRDQATVAIAPLQFDESGNKTGLFYGRIDQDRPEVDAQGRRCVLYIDQEQHDYDPSSWHPATKQAKDLKRAGKKKAAEEATLQRQLQKEQKKAKKALAQKTASKGTNAFFHFLNTNRQQFAQLIESNGTNGEPVPARAADVSKVAGKTWRALTQEARDQWQADATKAYLEQKNTTEQLDGAEGGGAAASAPGVTAQTSPLPLAMYFGQPASATNIKVAAAAPAPVEGNVWELHWLKTAPGTTTNPVFHSETLVSSLAE